jgi:O-antigen ligase
MAIGGGTVLLLLAALTRTWTRTWQGVLGRPPGIALVLLTLWTGVALFLTPPLYRTMAGGELLRVVAGTVAFFVAAYGLEARERGVAVTGLLFLGCLIALGDFARLGSTAEIGQLARSGNHSASVFGTHESVGSLLALLFPVALATALLADLDEKPRWAAYAGVLILGFAWIVARCRSAWIGGGIALLTLLILAWRASLRDPRRRPRTTRDMVRDALGSPLPLIVGALLVMGIGGGLATFLSQRAATFVNIKEDSSFQVRKTMWEGGAQMAAQKPVLGWGLGTYPILQGYWTHLGHEDWNVLVNGADHSDIAHNFYVQWAAEAGGVGLALHVAAVASWLLLALRGAVGRTLAPGEKAILLGTSAAALGACVDAIASPAYQFHGVYAVLWALMGLGSGALGEREPQGARVGALPWIVAGALGLLAAGAVPLWGRSLIAQADKEPRGTFNVVSDPPGPKLLPGQSVTLRAVFTDSAGKEASTSPGTTWEVPSERESGTLNGGFGQDAVGKDAEIKQALLQLTLPSKPGAIVQVMARYSDRRGRAYTADAVFILQGTKTKPER